MKERRFKEDYVLEAYIDERGREKRRAVYRGKWYRLDADAQGGKKLCLYSALGWACFAALYLFYMKLSTPSAWCMYVLPIAAAALIPLLYWAMGLVSMLRAPQVMTRVQREASVGRVMRSAMGCMILLGTAAVGDVIFMMRRANRAAEAPGFALLVCAAAVALGAFRYVKPHYDAIRETPAPEGEHQT